MEWESNDVVIGGAGGRTRKDQKGGKRRKTKLRFSRGRGEKVKGTSSSSFSSAAAKQFPFFMKAINGKTQDAEKKGENNGGEGRIMFVLRW